MAKLSCFANLLKITSMSFTIGTLLVGCQTTEDINNKDNLSIHEEQEMRDSMYHGQKDRVVPIINKTYDLSGPKDTTPEPDSE